MSKSVTQVFISSERSISHVSAVILQRICGGDSVGINQSR